jgi:hypothetical protein
MADLQSRLAYDSMHLELLAFVFAGSGLPEEVWKPMLDMAPAPRCIKVLNAVGEWWLPTSGMLPGCPGATFCMDLLLERWRRGTRAVSLTAQVRCWVDDSTAIGRGRSGSLAVFVGAVRGMEDLEQGDGVRVNRKKSGAVVSHACLQRLVEEAAAVRKAAPLGMVLGYGDVEPAEWVQQWRCALQAPAGTVFRWHGSRPATPAQVAAAKVLSEAARLAEGAAADLALAAKEAVDVVGAAAEALAAATGCTVSAILPDTGVSPVSGEGCCGIVLYEALLSRAGPVAATRPRSTEADLVALADILAHAKLRGRLRHRLLPWPGPARLAVMSSRPWLMWRMCSLWRRPPRCG